MTITYRGRLTTAQFQTLFALGSGPCRCSYGNASHASLLRRGYVAIQAGEDALVQELQRKARQKSTLHT